jgi:alpha-amylase/alpha-mannosidase (GH57 family)
LSGPDYFCVHGHFYQPPREDPLTGAIGEEPGAAPYRNWNERIHAECYRPNAALNNFGRISFNAGPTLLSWMQAFDEPTYSAILAQDQMNFRQTGAGNAIAQAYNHTILPLATEQDRLTQVRWGIADFSHRFGRKPRGIWLPETAVNSGTLETLAASGLEFTILAPWQANNPQVDTTQPYQVDLPSGKSIVVFFYNQELSTRVSFDPGSTVNADLFLADYVQPKVAGGTPYDRPRLILVASDGELYGHHQRFRDQFLAHLMNGALAERQLEWIYPELWLERYPVTEKIAIRENTSWSCHHGVKRWYADCGCTPNAIWKAPLRGALDELAGIIDGYYAEEISRRGLDPWTLRDEYIHVILGEMTVEQLVSLHPTGDTDADTPAANDTLWRIETLLAGQYHRQRMFTSCGWFFEDFDRIEPRNNVAYAAQAAWLTSLACEVDYVQPILDILKPVQSARTGLTADKVFSYHYNRAKNYWPG